MSESDRVEHLVSDQHPAYTPLASSLRKDRWMPRLTRRLSGKSKIVLGEERHHSEYLKDTVLHYGRYVLC